MPCIPFKIKKLLLIWSCFAVWVLLPAVAVADEGTTPVPQSGSRAGVSAAEALESSDADTVNEFDEFDEFEMAEAPAVFDPLRGYNRFMTVVNDHFYVLLFRPLAAGYRFVVWEPVRLAIDRAFNNAEYPERVVNNLLQLKFKGAWIETARFFVNTTIGLAGLFDPAKKYMDLDAYPEDFGQTLGHYGAGSGFPLVLPVMGPSNLRDLIGFGPDMFLDYATYVKDGKTVTALGVGKRLNIMSLYLDEYDAMRAEAIDLYVLQRDVYEMRRRMLIKE